MTGQQDQTVFTVTEAADFLRCGKSTLYWYMQRGFLVGSKVGGARRFTRDQLLDCLEATRQELDDAEHIEHAGVVTDRRLPRDDDRDSIPESSGEPTCS